MYKLKFVYLKFNAEDVSNENLLCVIYSGSDYEKCLMSESESGTSDSETLVTHVSSNWRPVTDCDLGPTPISVKNIDLTTEPVQYFYLFCDIYFLKLILQETTLNGNKRKMQSMPPTKIARITDWSPPTLLDIKAVLGIVINMVLHPMSYHYL
jgi:hypothetical protein